MELSPYFASKLAKFQAELADRANPDTSTAAAASTAAPPATAAATAAAAAAAAGPDFNSLAGSTPHDADAAASPATAAAAAAAAVTPEAGPDFNYPAGSIPHDADAPAGAPGLDEAPDGDNNDDGVQFDEMSDVVRSCSDIPTNAAFGGGVMTLMNDIVCPHPKASVIAAACQSTSRRGLASGLRFSCIKVEGDGAFVRTVAATTLTSNPSPFY